MFAVASKSDLQRPRARFILRTARVLLTAALAGFLLACNESNNPVQVTTATNATLPSREHTTNSAGDTNGTMNLLEEVEIDIDKSTEHLVRGNALLEQRQFPEAVEQFKLAVKFNPDDEDLYYNLALAQARAGDTESAKQNYRRSLELYPDYVEAHNNLGNILVAEGQFAEAIAHFEEALKHDEQKASTHNNLGTAYARQKKVAHSLVHYETAVQLQPDYPEAQFNLGNAYFLIGRVDDAIDQFSRILQRHPGFQPARVQLEKAEAARARAASQSQR